VRVNLNVRVQLYVDEENGLEPVEDTESFREKYGGVALIGKSIGMYITIGPHVDERFKQYPSESTTSRTMFLAIVIDKTHLRMISYNLSKTTTIHLNTLIYEEICWLRNRYLLFNSALT
jgi:hypothetical protein